MRASFFMDTLWICVILSLSSFIKRSIACQWTYQHKYLRMHFDFRYFHLASICLPQSNTIECYLLRLLINTFHFLEVNSFINCTFEMGFNTLARLKMWFQIHNSYAFEYKYMLNMLTTNNTCNHVLIVSLIMN